MPKATMKEEAQWKLPANTPLEAKLLSVKERVIDFRNRAGEDDTFTKWEWEFEIVSGEYGGLRAWGDTDPKLTTHPDNLVRQWGEALRGRPFKLEEGIDTDDLLGLPCVIVVGNTTYTKKDGTTSYLTPVQEVYPPGTVPSSDPWATPGGAAASDPWAVQDQTEKQPPF